MSPAQLAANRRNARKSTGPRTEQGKAIAKMNALKHGVLAQTVVVRGHQFKESPQAFKRLCREFYVNLAPEGPLEELLVDQIVQASWRLRRARTAESGEIALSVDGGWWKRKQHNPLSLILNWPETVFSDPLETQLERSALGCHYLHYCLRDVCEAVEREGELTEAVLNGFKAALRNRSDATIRSLEQFRVWLAANPDKLAPEALRARHKEEVLKFLNRKIADLRRLEEDRDEREQAAERSHQSAAVLPADATLEKLLRYETALERQLYRAMNQLERLQRRRSGESIPAPLTLDIAEKG